MAASTRGHRGPEVLSGQDPPRRRSTHSSPLSRPPTQTLETTAQQQSRKDSLRRRAGPRRAARLPIWSARSGIVCGMPRRQATRGSPWSCSPCRPGRDRAECGAVPVRGTLIASITVVNRVQSLVLPPVATKARGPVPAVTGQVNLAGQATDVSGAELCSSPSSRQRPGAQRARPASSPLSRLRAAYAAWVSSARPNSRAQPVGN